ncbi:MAG TPA: glycosyltransferase family 39 protein, partial [bacterium]|nr:glycosyltransferase family 39 protein [bacterium]
MDRNLRRLTLLTLSILLIIGTVIRFVYLYHFSETVFFNPFLMDRHDQKTFILWAKQIQQHPWYVDGKPFYMAPFYPYFLALLLTLTGENLVAVLALQLLLDVLVCFLLFLIGCQIADERTGLIAAGLACFYRTFIVYSGTVLSDGIITLLYTVFIAMALLAQEKHKFWPKMAAGVTLGLAALAKPTIALFLPFLFLGLISLRGGRGKSKGESHSEKLLPQKVKVPSRSYQAGLKTFLVISVFCVLVILPVTVRNFWVSGRFIPICTNGPVNWAIGNSADSLGLFCYPQGPLLSVWSARFWKLQLTKAVLFFTSYEWPQNLNVYLLEEIIPSLRLAFVHFGLVVPVGLAGLVVVFFDWRRKFLFLTYTLTNIAWVIFFFITDRYRLPAVACLMVSAGYFFVWTYDHLKTNWKAILGLWSAVLLFAYFFNTVPGPRI